MDTEQLIQHFNQGKSVTPGTPEHDLLLQCSNDAMRITAELNGAYHTPEEIRKLMSQLTGKPIDGTFGLFPPFYSDFGKNITIGKNVFINACCCFQDQGGITLGDGSLIGHRVVLATINHGFSPEERSSCRPAPIVIGRNVWIGSGAIVLPGITIGDNAIVAAGAVVTRDVAADSVVAGTPARFMRSIAGMTSEEKRACMA